MYTYTGEIVDEAGQILQLGKDTRVLWLSLVKIELAD